MSRKIVIAILMIGGFSSMLVYEFNMQSQYKFQEAKIQKISEGELPREKLLTAGYQNLEFRVGQINMTGQGISKCKRGVATYFPTHEETKFVEVDWMHIFCAHGYLFTTILHLFYLWVSVIAGICFVFGSNATISGLVAVVLTVYLGHSALAGHALSIPIPTTLVAGLVAMFLASRKYPFLKS